MEIKKQWKRNKQKIQFISFLEIIGLAVCLTQSQAFEKEHGSWFFMTILGAMFIVHTLALLHYWKCPRCKKRQPFWERHHRASVGSLTNCTYCGTPFI